MWCHNTCATPRSLYKNNGRIALTTGIAPIIRSYLQKLGENVYPDLQCGFRYQCSTKDMTFSVKTAGEIQRAEHTYVHGFH